MDSDIVRVPLGYDLFRAGVIEAACRDAGYEVRLLRNEHPETGGWFALQPSHLLVRSDDLAEIEEIVDQTYRLEGWADERPR